MDTRLCLVTCIIGYHTDDGIWLGADSAGSDEYGSQTIRADTKIYQNGPMLIGACGSYRMSQLLRYMEIPKHPEGMPTFEYMVRIFVEACRKTLKKGGYTHVKNNEEIGGTWVVGYDNALFEIGDDFQVGMSTKDYVCIGSGEEYAYGAMGVLHDIEEDPVKAIKRALKIAAQHNAFVAAPFLVRKLQTG